MYSIVKTYEQEGAAASRPVLVCIHGGATDCLDNYWAAWNAKNPTMRRVDEVIETDLPCMEAALKAIRKYC